jgi:KaiC/GvpD/RAD55 family RecA-like ATPase
MLHQCAAGIDGVLVVSVYHANPTGERDAPGSITHHNIGDVESMVETITAHDGVDGANVFVGLQVMRKGLGRGKRGGEADIVAVLGLVADMDADTGKAGELPFEPSYILETSPGNEQPAWLFDRPLAVADAKPLAAALRRATGSDAGTADITHIWRIPGTSNWPNAAKLARGRPPGAAEVSVTAPWDGALVSVEELTAALQPYLSSQSTTALIEVGQLPDVAGLSIDSEMGELLASDGQPDRSAHAARVVEALSFRGHTLEQSLALIVDRAGDWAKRYATEDALRKDVARLWAKFGADHAAGSDAGAKLVANLQNKRQPPAAANDELGVRLLSYSEFKALDHGTGSAVIKGLVRSGTLIAIGGRPGAGKTALMVAIADALDKGEAFFGRETAPTTVAYIAAEDGSDVANRLEAIENTSIKIVTSKDGFTLTKPDKAAALVKEVIRQAKALEPDRHVMVVVDTLRAALGGQSVLEDRVVSPALNALREVAEKEGAVIAVLNHTNRENNKATKGETLEAVTALEIVLLDGDGGWHDVYIGKNRSGPGQRNIGRVRYTSVQIGDVTAAIIDQMVADDSPASDAPKERGPSENARLFQTIALGALATSTDMLTPFGHTGPRVKAAAISQLRQEFYARKAGLADSKIKAFNRALEYWLRKEWIVRGDFGEEGAIWLASKAEESRTLN